MYVIAPWTRLGALGRYGSMDDGLGKSMYCVLEGSGSLVYSVLQNLSRIGE